MGVLLEVQRLIRWLKNEILSIDFLQFIYPPYCRNCKVYISKNQVFCDACSKNLRCVATLLLAVTPKYSLKVFAAFAYEEPVKTLIYRKFSGDILASKQLARLMVEYINLRTIAIDCLVPVPLHITRFAKRGFNQANVIAQELGKAFNIPVYEILKRTKRTAFQSSLPVKDRNKNVEGVFAFKTTYKHGAPNVLEGKTILIVDDLLTTGATLRNVAKLLIRYRPRRIIAAVAARTC